MSGVDEERKAQIEFARRQRLTLTIPKPDRPKRKPKVVHPKDGRIFAAVKLPMKQAKRIMEAVKASGMTEHEWVKQAIHQKAASHFQKEARRKPAPEAEKTKPAV